MSTDQDLQSTEVEPSDYNQKRRHATLNDLRERVYRARDRAYDAMADGHSESLKNDMIRASVENYITELEPRLKNTEQGKKYWEEVKLGDVPIPPPNDGRDYREELGFEVPREGLQEYQSSPKRFEADFTYETDDIVIGRQVGSETNTVSMPEHISWNAFRAANEFAYQVGLDIKDRDDLGEFGFTELTEQELEEIPNEWIQDW